MKNTKKNTVPKKINDKNKLLQEELDDFKFRILHSFTNSDIMNHLISLTKQNINDCEKDIEGELGFIEWTAYPDQKTNARADLKRYRDEKKNHEAILEKLIQLQKILKH